MKAPVIALLASVALASVATATPTVYFIRHGEKPPSGNGLSAQGLQRAQCLKTVFGASSQYNIGHIMAQTPQSDGSQSRPYNTVLPLAQSIGLTVDTSCQRDDSSCVEKVVKSLSVNTKNILICWEHDHLNNLAEALGADGDIANYPDDRYDLIWTDPPKYTKITNKSSENCPGLD